MKIKSIFYTLITLAVIGCTGYDPEVSLRERSDMDLMSILDANEYSIFLDALDHAQIELGNDVTVFAPTNAAFNTLFAEMGIDYVTDIPAAELANILNYHIISGQKQLDALSASESTILANKTLYFDGDIINGRATIIDGNRIAANGIFHGINRVLNVPANTVMDIISGNEEFSMLEQALLQTGLNTLLSGSSNVTVAAPNNQAFEDAGITDVTTIPNDELKEILQFHIFNGRIFTQQFTENELLPSILGTEADQNVQEVFIGAGPTFNDAEIVEANIVATNGVVHEVSSLVMQDRDFIDLFDPAINSTTVDEFGFDTFGDVVNNFNYAPLTDLSKRFTIYAPLFGKDAADFATEAEAIEYIEKHTFEGIQRIPSMSNGAKIESVGGDEYFIAKRKNGRTYVNGIATNAFRSSTTSFSFYNGVAYLFNKEFKPLPAENIVEVLAADPDFELISAAIQAAGKVDELSAEGITFLALDDATFEAETGLATPTAVMEADPAMLTSLIDRHTIGEVFFDVVLSNDFPTTENVLGEEVFFAEVGGNLVVIEDQKNPDVKNEEITDTDILANNGVIHVIDGALDF